MNLCGININCHQFEELLKFSGEPKLVVTVNSEAIVRSQSDSRLKNIINNNTSTIDGQIPLWLYRHKYKNIEINKISGSELIYSLPEYAEKENLKVFLLGGHEDSNKGAVIELKKRYPNLEIDGFSPLFSPYPFPDSINICIIDKITQFKPDFLFVGFGMGKQEFWEEDNYSTLKDIGVKMVIGCGGSFDFASGTIKRAPVYIQNIGLEGIWRLLQEFKWFRLKRLLLSTKIFYYYFFSKNKYETK